ncbi:hypothetical protein ACX0G9_01230 [Flavitalea flava]
MKRKRTHAYIPAQKTGEETETPAVVDAPTEQEAMQLFSKARERLLNVSHWADLCGPLSATFLLTDDKGNAVNGLAAPGHYIKIDIPGPGTSEGNGYDWVRVEKTEHHHLSENYELFLLQARPSPNPQQEDSKETAHFLEEAATSSFVIERDRQHVRAIVYGRNEVPNTAVRRITDKIRNAIVGSTGAIGLSKLQWKALANGLLR